MRNISLAAFVCAVACSIGPRADAADKIPGVTDTQIRIGQTMPYSGPASAYAIQGQVEQAYFRKLNERGGINGRKVELISLDDAYSPPKTVEQTRKLVESDEVLLIYGTLGTPTNSSIQEYLNIKKVPQVLILSGASKWSDHFDPSRSEAVPNCTDTGCSAGSTTACPNGPTITAAWGNRS
jgi:branched-chain amino acid transport system substrate-binding protein